MKSFLRLRNAKKSLKVSLVFAAICCGSLIAAFLVGISDNWPGLFLCFIAATALILALVHSWRKVWKFLILLGASVIGFAIFAILHNVFYALAEVTSNIVLLHYLFEFLHAACFLIAIFVGPGGFLVGAVGSVVMAVINFKRRQSCETVS